MCLRDRNGLQLNLDGVCVARLDDAFASAFADLLGANKSLVTCTISGTLRVIVLRMSSCNVVDAEGTVTNVGARAILGALHTKNTTCVKVDLTGELCVCACSLAPWT